MRKVKFWFFLLLLLALAVVFLWFFEAYWTHRYDHIIARQARIYRLDEELVWSIIYEETYFRAWKRGAAGEIGLMQITPAVAREWAAETGLKSLEKQVEENLEEFLFDPERNIQIGCWYLEKLRGKYRGLPAETAMMLAAYNAGASRVEEWLKNSRPEEISEAEFIERIAIPSTKSYVISILKRYRKLKN
ncbi:MAG: hypothetical protein KatS3mg006_0926 [Pyrinomonadaceae bacterium]|nr:MAG: hypothetical protein KatS3mg006_0926 [Pyrinomonadaceae bacterium]